jgi:hypothetical protein
MKFEKFSILAIVTLMLSACGANYSISRYDGMTFGREEFAKDEYSCELQATAISRPLDNGSVMGGISRDLNHNEMLIKCMESKGWKYTKTKTNLF